MGPRRTSGRKLKGEMARRGPEKQDKEEGECFRQRTQQMRNGGKGGTVVTAEASEVYKGPIIKGLKCQVK